MTGNQNVQMQRVKTGHQYPERYKNATGRDFKVEKIMKFLSEIEMFEEI